MLFLNFGYDSYGKARSCYCIELLYFCEAYDMGYLVLPSFLLVLFYKFYLLLDPCGLFFCFFSDEKSFIIVDIKSEITYNKLKYNSK